MEEEEGVEAAVAVACTLRSVLRRWESRVHLTADRISCQPSAFTHKYYKSNHFGFGAAGFASCLLYQFHGHVPKCAKVAHTQTWTCLPCVVRQQQKSICSIIYVCMRLCIHMYVVLCRKLCALMCRVTFPLAWWCGVVFGWLANARRTTGTCAQTKHTRAKAKCERAS